jgi:hypothetical protein
MNIATYGRLVDSHVAELHQCRARSRRNPPVAAAEVPRSVAEARGVRRRIGVALVEAGLHLLASKGSSLPAPYGTNP